MQRGERIPRIPCLYFNTFTVHTPTPDGTADWNQWTLATLSYAGGTACSCGTNPPAPSTCGPG